MPSSGGVTHLIDTDVLVNIRDIHGDSSEIWKAVIAEIEAGRLKTVRQVVGELERRFKDIHARLKPYLRQFQLPDDITYSQDVIDEVRYINTHHSKLYNPLGATNPADPFLIAVAKTLGAMIVTDEKKNGPRHESRIPYVCAQRNVGSSDRLDYLKSIGLNV